MIVSPFGSCNLNMWQCEPLTHFPFFIASVEKHVPGSFEKARLRFAHAETVVPFSCLLGLFLEESGEASIVFS
jgi:hypothetical protein